jgi:hypothetical protein
MNRDLETLLEVSLSQIEAGKARIQSCLLSFPDEADELEPLLHAAETLWSLPKPTLSEEAKARIEAKLLAAASANRRLRPARGRRPRVGFRLGWVFGALTALLVFMLLSTSFVQAAGHALPDSALYPIKLAAEDAWLWLAPARVEPELHLRFAQRRLDELEALAAQGVFDEAVLAAMTEHTESALAGAEGLPPALAGSLVDELVSWADEQDWRLSGLLGSTAADHHDLLNAAMEASSEQKGRAMSLGNPTPTEPPGQTKTPQPPGQTKTPEPPGQTKTPQPPGQTKTPEPPGQTKTPEPPGQTKTPEPPGKTKTPQPPGQTKTPQPPGKTKTPEPPGQTKTPEPPGQTKTPEPPGQTKTPEPPGKTKTPEPPGKTKPPKPPKP